MMRSRADSYPHEVDLRPYLSRIDINEAASMGVNIRLVALCSNNSSRDLIRQLYANIDDWADKFDTCLETSRDTRKYTYGGPRYNGRVRSGTESDLTRYFSDFIVYLGSDRLSMLSDFSFIRLDKYDLAGYEPGLQPSSENTLSMLKIAYGVMKKYDVLIEGIYGVIPGIVEDKSTYTNQFSPKFEPKA